MSEPFLDQSWIWLFLFCLFVGALVFVGALIELHLRSDYHAFVKHQRALEKQRGEYVPPVRVTPIHKRTASRAGVVK